MESIHEKYIKQPIISIENYFFVILMLNPLFFLILINFVKNKKKIAFYVIYKNYITMNCM